MYNYVNFHLILQFIGSPLNMTVTKNIVSNSKFKSLQENNIKIEVSYSCLYYLYSLIIKKEFCVT